MTRLRVLVLAEAVDVNRTSEGICTLKFLRTLVQSGCEVRCRYGSDPPDPLPFHIGCVFERVTYSRFGLWNAIAFLIRRSGRVGIFLMTLIQRRYGFSPKFKHDVQSWVRTARDEIARFKPHIIFTRGRGASFRTHAAMLEIQPRPVWIANYHDPWPQAHYPAPYAFEEPGTKVQLAHLDSVMRAADWLTFPSQRLQEWFVKYHPYIDVKSTVLPHVMLADDASATPGALKSNNESKSWIVLHVGTLLGPRDPGPLIRAFIHTCSINEGFRTHARLRFIGPVHTPLPDIPVEFSELVEIQNGRVSYVESQQIIRTASALVVIEAIADASPFLPAKFTDYLAAHVPVLVLTPGSSELSRLLGEDYPYLAANGDEERITQILLRLWNDRQLQRPEPPVLSSIRQHCSETAVGATFQSIASMLLDRSVSHTTNT